MFHKKTSDKSAVRNAAVRNTNVRNRFPSVKEGIDNLPFGIAFARPSGMVILCNRTMHTVSYALSNTQLQNAELFWRYVKDEGERTLEGAYILRLSEGTVWLVSRRQCMLSGRTMYELTAQDVSERIRLIDKISRDNEHLATIGERLKQHNKNALELARSRELLERKEHTHDELGQLLGATRHYLSGGDADADSLWHRWHITAALMLEESKLPATEDVLCSLKKTAADVGVKLNITGDIPQSSITKDIILAAGGECMTNLLRHTQGNELRIDIENRGDKDILVFTDNGDCVYDEIIEGGGLSSIRRKVEGVGGIMEVIVQPEYKLVLTVPAVK